MKTVDINVEKRTKSTENVALVELVNGILKKSFGPRVRGNCQFGWDRHANYLSLVERLDRIYKFRTEPKPRGAIGRFFKGIIEPNQDGMDIAMELYKNSTYIGKFGIPKENNIKDITEVMDGSQITIPYTYKSQAEIYAQLYEAALEKEVQIFLE